jgi:hypothetical protein
MVWNYHGKPIPLEVYHGVPKGWCANEILAAHAQMGGTFDLRGPEATEPGAPDWMPERYAWLQYRNLVRRLADGILADDPACVELVIRYIELRYIGSYSGYLRSVLSRRLKHASLTPSQKARLHRHFLRLVAEGDRTLEFRDYLGLWRRIVSPQELASALAEIQNYPDGQAKAAWLKAKFDQSPGSKPSK